MRCVSKIEVRYGSRCEVRSTQILNVRFRTAILGSNVKLRQRYTLIFASPGTKFLSVERSLKTNIFAVFNEILVDVEL